MVARYNCLVERCAAIEVGIGLMFGYLLSIYLFPELGDGSYFTVDIDRLTVLHLVFFKICAYGFQKISTHPYRVVLLGG